MSKKEIYEAVKSGDYRQAIAYLSEFVHEAEYVTGPNGVYRVLLDKYGARKTESFFVITLNGAHGVIRCIEITKGLANRTMVHPREVFREAIIDGACAIIIAHNHPSGKIMPSPEDLDITKRLCEAGKIIGIEVIDHLIFSTKKNGNEYLSLVETGDMGA